MVINIEITSSNGIPLKKSRSNVMKIGPAITAHWPFLKTGVELINMPHHRRICNVEIILLR